MHIVYFRRDQSSQVEAINAEFSKLKQKNAELVDSTAELEHQISQLGAENQLMVESIRKKDVETRTLEDKIRLLNDDISQKRFVNADLEKRIEVTHFNHDKMVKLLDQTNIKCEKLESQIVSTTKKLTLSENEVIRK